MAERTVLLITLLIGAVGWLFTHVVERVSNSPTVEYQLIDQRSRTSNLLQVKLLNVTRSTSFSNVRVLLVAPEGGEIKDVSIRPREPAFEGDTEPHVYGRGADVTIQRFMPGDSFSVAATYTGAGRPTLRASAADVPIHFEERGLETFFAKNEVLIFSVLAAIWALLTAIIFGHWFFVTRKTDRSGAVAHPDS